MSDYAQKLKNPLWQKRRLEIMQKANFKCEVCSRETRTLHVHHIFYVSGRDPWDYPDAVLVCLCDQCHKVEHDHLGIVSAVEDLIGTFLSGYHNHKEGIQMWQLLLSLKGNKTVKDRYSWLIAHLYDAEQELCKEDKA